VDAQPIETSCSTSGEGTAPAETELKGTYVEGWRPDDHLEAGNVDTNRQEQLVLSNMGRVQPHFTFTLATSPASVFKEVSRG
jgi:hypothetical protein